LLSRENKEGAGILAGAGGRIFGEVSASRLVDAAENVETVTVFEQRRLLRQAADEIWKFREEEGLSSARLSIVPNDLVAELRQMADQILRTPRPLLRLALWEAALALRELERMIEERQGRH
jgi:hypothetical protein